MRARPVRRYVRKNISPNLFGVESNACTPVCENRGATEDRLCCNQIPMDLLHLRASLGHGLHPILFKPLNQPKIMADNRIRMPSSEGGIVRYGDEATGSHLVIKPEYIVGLCIAAIIILIALRLF